MLTLHPYFLEKDGKKEFAILPYDEFIALQQQLDDFQDLMDLREAKRIEHTAQGVTLDQVRALLHK